MAASVAEPARRRSDCPIGSVALLAAAVVGSVVWNVVELGLLEARKP